MAGLPELENFEQLGNPAEIALRIHELAQALPHASRRARAARDQDTADLKTAVAIESDEWAKMIRQMVDNQAKLDQMVTSLEQDKLMDQLRVDDSEHVIVHNYPRHGFRALMPVADAPTVPEENAAKKPRGLRYKLETPIFKSIAEQKVARQEITDMVALLKEQLNRFEAMLDDYKAALAANGEEVAEAMAKLTISLESINNKLPDSEGLSSKANGTDNSIAAPAVGEDAMDSSNF